MTSYYRISVFLLLLGAICEPGISQIEENVDLSQFQQLQQDLRSRLTDPLDGSFERKVKDLVSEFLVETAVESVTSNNARTLQQVDPNIASPQILQQPQIIEVYGTPPRTTTERIRRTRPSRTTRTPRPPRTRRPETTPAPQIVYIPYPVPAQQQQPVYNPQYPPPAYQPVQQPPPYQQQQPQRQDLISPAQNGNQRPLQQQPAAPPQNPPTPILQPQQQPAPPPVQVVYLPATTPASITTQRPLTSPRPTPSQEHVYNQVHKILDNVAVGNITGIVDQALGIRAPMPTRNFVNGILNTVFCSPINRLLGRCRGS